ncbi:MAG: phosphoribosyltransferase [Burkholderiales bacterium]|jgi:hypoxanthine phosphoribosyltransferase|nr:phosphoribosyltransferase [Burkholderiales bacterium]
MEKLHVGWQEYHRLIERLAFVIYESGWRFDQIVCVARGGMRVGDVLSRIFDLPLAILATQSYRTEGGTVRGKLIIAEHMSMTTRQLGEHVLLVDDMTDSGITLQKIIETLPCRYPNIEKIKTAVLWWKAHAIFKPDYWVDYLPNNPWICQPFEIYDSLGAQNLKQYLEERTANITKTA